MLNMLKTRVEHRSISVKYTGTFESFSVRRIAQTETGAWLDLFVCAKIRSIFVQSNYWKQSSNVSNQTVNSLLDCSIPFNSAQCGDEHHWTKLNKALTTKHLRDISHWEVNMTPKFSKSLSHLPWWGVGGKARKRWRAARARGRGLSALSLFVAKQCRIARHVCWMSPDAWRVRSRWRTNIRKSRSS